MKLITKNLKVKEVNVFECRHDEHFKSQKSFHLFKTCNEKATEAPYRVSYCIALAGEVQTITETLRNLCTMDTAECLVHDKFILKRYDSATSQWYSNSSNARSGCKCEDWVNIPSAELYLCLTNGLIYRYVWLNLVLILMEELFFPLSMWMPDNKTGAEIANILNNFLESHGLSFEYLQYVDTCLACKGNVR